MAGRPHDTITVPFEAHLRRHGRLQEMGTRELLADRPHALERGRRLGERDSRMVDGQSRTEALAVGRRRQHTEDEPAHVLDGRTPAVGGGQASDQLRLHVLAPHVVRRQELHLIAVLLRTCDAQRSTLRRRSHHATLTNVVNTVVPHA